MLKVYLGGEKYYLRFHGGEWRDKAGHVWAMDRQGNFTSKHGAAPLASWNLVADEGEARERPE